MSIKVKVVKGDGPIDVTIYKKSAPSITVKIPFEIDIARTIDGQILVKDHPEIDIVIDPLKNKIMTMNKEGFDYESYGHSDEFFNAMHKAKIIEPDSIKASNVFGSFEALIRKPILDSEDSLQQTLLTVARFIVKERDFFNYTSDIKKEMEKRLFTPEDHETTELGEIPHEEAKGSIVPGLVRRFGQGYYYIYEGKQK